MLDLASLGAFVAVVLGLFIIPGPAVLLVVTCTAQGGRKAGVMTGLGIATGDFLHTTFAAIGLSAVLMTSALAFTIIKLAGAFYLVYLGVRAVLAKQSSPASVSLISISPLKAYLQAVPTEVLNPKTAIFFLAFMPQFVDQERGSVFFQFASLGLIFVAMSSVYTTLVALSVRPLGRLLGRLSWLSRWQGKIVGAVLIALGLKVAVQQN